MNPLDEPVHVVPYDAAWPQLAQAEMQRLRHALREQVIACEHFGSTSVPGCDAKPIVDLLVGVEAWPVSESVRAQLSALGYEDCDEAGIPGRLYFRARGVRSFNLAVTVHLGELWRSNVQIRDLLRGDAALVRAYVDVKRTALREGCSTLIAYSQRKAQLMTELALRASLAGSRRR